jgi:hypothetical protein
LTNTTFSLTYLCIKLLCFFLIQMS